MKFAFSIFKYFPYGGIQRDLMKFVTECLHRKHQVRIYMISWEGEVPAGVELVRIPVRAWSRHKLYALFAHQVRDHLWANPVDLHVGMNKMPGLDVYYAGDSCYEEKARSQRNALYRLLPRYRHFAEFERAVFAAGGYTEILTISDVQTPLFRRHYATEPERFHPVPPGIDRDRIAKGDQSAQREAFRLEFGIAKHEQLLLFVGSGFIKKGLDRVLLGLHALPGERLATTWLFVLGKDNADPFRRMAKRLGISHRIRFFAEGRSDVPRFLFGADGLVLPAYDETAGMAILEAMVAGLPALVTQNCGYSIYLAEADAGLITPMPFSQPIFNEQLERLLTSPDRQLWSQRGRALAGNDEIFALTMTAVNFFERFAAQRSLRVAFMLFKYFPYGGLQRDFLFIALACRDLGYQVRVYTLAWEGPVPEGIEVRIVDVPARASHRRYCQFSRSVNASLALQPVDVVVGFNKLPNLDVYYSADPCYEAQVRQNRGLLYRQSSRYRLLSRFERAVFDPRAKTRILSNSPARKAEFEQYYHTPEHRFHNIPPGVSKDRRPGGDHARVRRSFRESHGLDEQKILLLAIGSEFISKGVDRALVAVASLPQRLIECTRLFVIGQGETRYFQAQAEELGIADRVSFVGGRDDIQQFLLGADLLLQPAQVENDEVVLLEALICGLPVLATDVCRFAHYVSLADGGLLLGEPFDPRDMTTLLIRMLDDEKARKKWRENGLHFGNSAGIYDMPEQAARNIAEQARERTLSA